MGRVWFEKRNIQKILPTTDNRTTKTNSKNNKNNTVRIIQQEQLSLYSKEIYCQASGGRSKTQNEARRQRCVITNLRKIKLL